MTLLNELLNEAAPTKLTKKELSKDGIKIGKTTKGGDITVHSAKHDINGNWSYQVSYPPLSRKKAVQHIDAVGGMNAVRDVQEFANDKHAKQVAKKLVKYINKFMIKDK